MNKKNNIIKNTINRRLIYGITFNDTDHNGLIKIGSAGFDINWCDKNDIFNILADKTNLINVKKNIKYSKDKKLRKFGKTVIEYLEQQARNRIADYTKTPGIKYNLCFLTICRKKDQAGIYSWFDDTSFIKPSQRKE